MEGWRKVLQKQAEDVRPERWSRHERRTSTGTHLWHTPALQSTFHYPGLDFGTSCGSCGRGHTGRLVLLSRKRTVDGPSQRPNPSPLAHPSHHLGRHNPCEGRQHPLTSIGESIGSFRDTCRQSPMGCSEHRIQHTRNERRRGAQHLRSSNGWMELVVEEFLEDLFGKRGIRRRDLQGSVGRYVRQVHGVL